MGIGGVWFFCVKRGNPGEKNKTEEENKKNFTDKIVLTAYVVRFTTSVKDCHFISIHVLQIYIHYILQHQKAEIFLLLQITRS